MKSNNDKIFITENLTQFRTSIVKGLADLKFNGHIYTYWTSDGRIYVKRFNNSRQMLIRSHKDIRDMLQIAADDEDDLVIHLTDKNFSTLRNKLVNKYLYCLVRTDAPETILLVLFTKI